MLLVSLLFFFLAVEGDKIKSSKKKQMGQLNGATILLSISLPPPTNIPWSGRREMSTEHEEAMPLVKVEWGCVT